MTVPTFVELVDHVRQQERRMTDLERQMQTLAKDASMHLDASNGRVFFLEKEQAKTTVEILALKTKIMTLEQRLDEHGAEHEPAAENIRMMRVHDRGKGKMFIPDDEFNAYVNDLILDDMKRCAPERAAVASAHNTLSGALAPSPADDAPDAPVRCPNCGAPMKWDGRSYICSSSIGDCSILKIDFVTDTTKAKAAAAIQRIVRRMAYHPEKAGAK